MKNQPDFFNEAFGKHWGEVEAVFYRDDWCEESGNVGKEC